jgi:site-specific DNA-methyltransferase (adenine-specific)
LSAACGFALAATRERQVASGNGCIAAMTAKRRAPRNRTLCLSPTDLRNLQARLLHLAGPVAPLDLENRTIHEDLFAVLDWLPQCFVDLLVLDPPYNLSKEFHGLHFIRRTLDGYIAWVESWFIPLLQILKPTASVYFCGDWRSSAAIEHVLEKHLIVRNRITWEREKGRGARRNWKNCSEDIWFATVSEHFTFHADAVKLKRRVLAPYTDAAGKPKDWTPSENGNHRLTHPSNLWTDLTVPFWSMPENTDHPTQKPEKLLAKLILASSNPGDMVFDPFFGSGTALVTAKKLGRRFAGVEADRTYCLLAEKRLARADHDAAIQGYRDGVFWERNTLAEQQR